MIIKKNDKEYLVMETKTKWKLERRGDKIDIMMDIAKDLCPTEASLQTYVLENELF